jgi:hypothetical protein
MGRYRDRMMAQQAQAETTGPLALTSQESSIPVPDDNPVVDRLNTTIKYMMGLFARNPNARNHVAMKLGTKMVTEMLSDLKDSDMHPDVMAFYMKQLGSVILWTGTGEKTPDLPWPEDFEV